MLLVFICGWKPGFFFTGPPFVRAMRNTSVVSGQTAVMHCRVTGYPIHSISWKKG